MWIVCWHVDTARICITSVQLLQKRCAHVSFQEMFMFMFLIMLYPTNTRRAKSEAPDRTTWANKYWKNGDFPAVV